MSILKNTMGYSPWFFPKKDSKITPHIFIKFSDTYNALINNWY